MWCVTRSGVSLCQCNTLSRTGNEADGVWPQQGQPCAPGSLLTAYLLTRGPPTPTPRAVTWPVFVPGPRGESPQSHDDQYDLLPEEGGQEVGLLLKAGLWDQSASRLSRSPAGGPWDPWRAAPRASLTRRHWMSSGICVNL